MESKQDILTPKVAIVVLNWNGWQDTIECLESVFRNEYPRYQVIVCDNDSQDGSLGHIKAWAEGRLEYVEYDRAQAEAGGDPKSSDARLVLIKTGANLGFAGGNNVGLRYALANNFDFAWLLNNDTVIKPDALTYLVERMQENPRAGICGSTVAYYRDITRVEAWGGAFYDKWLAVGKHLGISRPVSAPVDVKAVERKMDYVFGAAMFVSRDFLLDVGLMSEDYFIYCEEIDWAIRARGRYALAYAPKSIVYHKGSRSIGSAGSSLSKYYEMRNRMVVTRKHFPYALPTVYLGVVVEMIGMFLRGEWGGAKIIWDVLYNARWLKPPFPSKV